MIFLNSKKLKENHVKTLQQRVNESFKEHTKEYANDKEMQRRIEEVLRRVSITATISKYVEVDKRDNNYWTKCPFHQDESLSMEILEEEGIYHCLGCRVSGNVIDFVCQKENISYSDAIQKLSSDKSILKEKE